MANRSKQQKFIEIKVDNPSLPDKEAVLRAGYSRKRASVAASILRRNSKVQAEIRARLSLKLQAAPSVATYHETLARAKEAAMRSNSSNAAWILLQIANLEGREVLPQPETESKLPLIPRSVEVRFVATELSEPEAALVNKSAAEFEAQTGMPLGSMGRVVPESRLSIEAQVPVLKPVPQVKDEDAVLLLPISDDERKRLQRLCLPVGGALKVNLCRAHGSYETMWQQRADQTWGWSDCPTCWTN